MAAKVKWYRGAWWLHVHHQGKKRQKKFGPTKADKRRADRLAEEVNHRLALGLYSTASETPERPVPFGTFANEWLRREVELPIERGHRGHLASGTARVYATHVNVHLAPFFGSSDVRSIGLREVQAFYDRCIDTGKPASAKSIDMSLNVLRLVLGHARGQGLVEANAVQTWKSARPRRRASSEQNVPPEKVLSALDLERVLAKAASEFPNYYAFVLFQADTGCRLGEVVALAWSEVDLDAGTARIHRSFSSDTQLGPTKTGRERVVELSTRLRCVLIDLLPNVYPPPEGALVFPNMSGGFIRGSHFRAKVFSKLIREALGKGRHHSPHDLRHTWASLHMARGTPLKWIQVQGGWTTAKVLLDTYGHYMPTESHGFADVLTGSDGSIRLRPDPVGNHAESVVMQVPDDEGEPASQLPPISPRSPIMHFTLPPPFL